MFMFEIHYNFYLFIYLFFTFFCLYKAVPDSERGCNPLFPRFVSKKNKQK